MKALWCGWASLSLLAGLLVGGVDVAHGEERQRGPIVRPQGVPRWVPAARQRVVRDRLRPTASVGRSALPWETTFRRNPAAPEIWRSIPQPPATAPDGQAPAFRREWVRRYRNVNSWQDWPVDIVVAPDGSSVVTGFSWGGVTTWDVATIKYAADGTEQWRRRYHGGPADRDWGNAVALDSAGNVYVAGQTGPSSTFRDYLVLKYSPDGQLLWTRRYSSPDLGGLGHSMALAVVIDDFDEIYVSGRSAAPQGVASGFDIVTLKFDSEGNELWRHRYGGMPRGGWGEELESMTLDPFGDLVLVGESPDSRGEESWIVAKISAEGSIRWLRHQRGLGGGGAAAKDVAVDTEGNIYVTGWRRRARGDGDILTIKYSPTGTSRWQRRFDGPALDADVGNSVDVDTDGNVFVTGSVWAGNPIDGGDRADVATLKYDAQGRLQWSQTLDGPSGGDDIGWAIVAAGDGGAFVSGIERRHGRGDFLTLRYSDLGVVLWKDAYEGPGRNDEAAYLMVRGPHGGIFVAGPSDGQLGSDMAVVKYVED